VSGNAPKEQDMSASKWTTNPRARVLGVFPFTHDDRLYPLPPVCPCCCTGAAEEEVVVGPVVGGRGWNPIIQNHRSSLSIL